MTSTNTPIPVAELTKIATNVSEFKTRLSVKKMYDDILNAAHEGKFSISIFLGVDDNGDPLADEWVAVEKVKTLFPGIKISQSPYNDICTFDWGTQQKDEVVERWIAHCEVAQEKVELANQLLREATQRAETAERKFLRLRNVLHNNGDIPNAYPFSQSIWKRYLAGEEQ